MSDKYQVIILPEAQKDIREIVLYIAKELSAPQAALKLNEELQKEIQSLEFMPKRIKLVEEQPWRAVGIRKTQIKNYYIYFLVDEENLTVKVNAVIYVGRNQLVQMTERKVDM